MYGGGNYELSAVKEIKVTNDFLSLNNNKKNCQTEESLEECTTKNGLQDIIDKCGCIHYKLANFSNSSEVPVCNQDEVLCFNKLSVSLGECLVPCEGIFADVWKGESADIDENTDGMKDIFKAYESFKNNLLEEISYPFGISGVVLLIVIYSIYHGTNNTISTFRL